MLYLSQQNRKLKTKAYKQGGLHLDNSCCKDPEQSQKFEVPGVLEGKDASGLKKRRINWKFFKTVDRTPYSQLALLYLSK